MKHVTLLTLLFILLASSFAIQAKNIEVQRYTMLGNGSVNTWIISSNEGVVVIDFQRDIENAQRAIEKIKAIGKPVKALLLTHSHPDHIGGIKQFMDAFPGVDMFASQATIDEIRDDTMGYQALTKKVLGAVAPNSYPLPNKVLKNTDTIRVGGLKIETKELGEGESVSGTVYYLPQLEYLFSGDIVSNKVTEFFLEKRTHQWLQQLQRLIAEYPNLKTAFPGHGDKGDASTLLTHTKHYIESFRALIASELTGDSARLSEKSINKIVTLTEAKFPNHPTVAAIPNLIALNAVAVAEEIVAQ